MSECIRPKGLCCGSLCDHPPECDHVGHGTYTTPWEPVWRGSEIMRWLQGAEWCNRCGWWLRETDPPVEAMS